MFKLTISIPTFDRNDLALRTVAALLPQLTPECQLVVIDNCSAVPVAETLAPVLGRYPEAKCTVVRNRANIGPNANILRCFELCESEWLWVLGDDDTVLPDAIQTILAVIAAHPAIVYASFASEIEPRSTTFHTRGLEDFSRRVDNFGNAMFISSSIYNRSKVIRWLHKGHQYTYSCAPHLLMAIAALGDDGECLFSEKAIVSRQLVIEEEQRNSVVVVTIGLSTILELPMSPEVRRLLAKAIEKSALNLSENVRELYYMALGEQDFDRARYLYDQVAYRLYYFDRRVATRLRIRAYRLTLIFPRIFGALNRWSARLTGRVIDQHSMVRRTD